MFKKYILGSLIIATFIGCGGGSSGASDSSHKKIAVETGYVLMDKEKREINYIGELTNKLGLGLFNENKSRYLVRLSAKRNVPDYKQMVVLSSDDIYYNCVELVHTESVSELIKDGIVHTIIGNNCISVGEANDTIKNIEVQFTDTMITQGASRIKIEGDKAYLKTNYELQLGFGINSSVGDRTYNQIFDLIKEHPEVKTIVPLSVTKNALNQDVIPRIGELMRSASLNTHLENNSTVHASGVELFVSGTHRTMDEGAGIFVQEWKYGLRTLDRNSTEHKAHVDFYNDMLGKPRGEEFYHFFINIARSKDRPHKLTEDEIAEYGLLTE